MALGLLLATGSFAVHAEPKPADAVPATVPAATPPAAPLNLTLQPTPTPAALAPALPQASTPLAPVVSPAMASAPASVPPAPAPAIAPLAAAPAGPIDLKLDPKAPPQASAVELAMQKSSEEVKRVVRWVADSADNGGLPFMLIDKANAHVYVFNRGGQLQGAAPALLGLAKGDRMLAPNSAPMSAMPPHVRITPAGRFVSRLAIDSTGKELLVLDYAASLSLHPVVKGKPHERRAERLLSATSQDNRVSFGCINVPVPFYQTVVSPAFKGTKGIVYVLPETGPASALFGIPAVVDTAVTGIPSPAGAASLAPQVAPAVPAAGQAASPGAQN